MPKFKVIKEHSGFDDCWNRPKNVDLKVGDILESNEETSNERGHLFFKINGDANNRVHPRSFSTKHPYDKGVFDLEYLQVIF